MTHADERGGVPGMGLFPDQNPNPVLRMSGEGELLYANAASAPIRAAWATNVGGRLPTDVVTELMSAARSPASARVEVTNERQTFAVLAVLVPELDAYNLYGTDITAAKVVERFPAGNPNPVLRMSPSGELIYANAASRPIIDALGIAVGDQLPGPLHRMLQAALADPNANVPEVAGSGGLTFRLKPVAIPEFDFVNLYGTDITAEKAVVRFPDENPNPVVRLTRSGVVTYANPASKIVRRALGAEVGGTLPEEMLARIDGALGDDRAGALEVEVDNRTFALRVVQLLEFDSINLYGTDITAARQVETFSRENEQLLLNILPASIAARLRGGETVIADRLDDMAVLFADVVGFTELSSRLAPTEVVGLLNEVFSSCDRLADRFGLEKIKTVGDAYMVVGGVGYEAGEDRQANDPSVAEDVADMGLALLEELAGLRHAHGTGLQLRAGMHIGPAVAGVIGLKKFIYDVWGDTVNTASRMESTGVPGRLQVTTLTRDRLARSFELQRRGVIDVKGKGPTETWFVLRRRDATPIGGGVAGSAADAPTHTPSGAR